MSKTREEMKDTLFAYLPSGMTMKNVNFMTEIDEIADYIEEIEAKLAEYENNTCGNCKSSSLKTTFIKDRTWMGTEKLPSEFFRSSEYDFGWDYYADGDINEIKCSDCGYISYKKG